MEVEATLPAGEEKMDWRSPVFVTADTVLAVRSTRGYSVWRLPLWGAGPATEVLPVAPEGIGSLSRAPAGDFLAFAAHAASSRIVSLTLGPDGRAGESRALATASRRMSNPRFSPDGRRLLYSRARGGVPPDVLVLDLESGAERSLEGLDGYPLWSSAASLVTWGAAGATSIDLETGQRRKLELPGPWLATGDRYRAAFRTPTPDLAQVVFGSRLEESPAALELFVWRAGEAEPRQLTELGAFSEFPSWSRDGRLLVFQVSRPERPEHDELWVVDVDGGGPPRRVLRSPGRSWGPAFDARGERVVYAAQRGGRWDLAIAVVAPSSDDGESEQRLGVSSGYLAYVRWPDWSPVEDRIVFEHTQMTADVWLMPLGVSRPAAGDS
jgi:Tol biopolymer transport system component